MTLANIRIYAAFMAILLLFSIFAGQPAIANPNALPESVAELLSGKTTDFSSVVSQLPDQQLLSALSAGEMLKFKAAHGEISLDVSGASAFINLINKRIEQSQIVSFVHNDTCCKPVEQREIVYEGQRLIIPAHFTAELDLSIISCAPAGEAGSICPDFCVNVFSQSPLTDKILKIDGEAVAPEKISIIQSAGKQQVLYRPDLDIAGLLSIGTHTAEIIISNKAEEKVRKNWQFIVGVYDIPTNPMPADLVLLKEVGLPLDKFLPGGKAFGELTALIYQNAKGERFIEYRLKAETGQIFTSQNLAFIARKAFKGRNTDNELQLFPKTHFAFAGNSLNFSYAYSGPGQVINEKWEIPSAGHSSADPVIIMTDNDVYARCVITVEEQFTNNNGEIETYTYQVTAEKRINSIGLKTSIQPDRSLIIADSASCSLSIGNITLCRLQTSGMVEGQQYNVTSDITGAPVTGVLKVNRLRWVKHASEGSSKVIDSVATTTTLLFEEPGYAELVLAVDLTWQEAGETYTSNYKPDVSGLYAFYPVTGKAKFTKYPIGQIRYTNRHLVIKSFEFTIKDQQITIDEPSDYQLTSPVHICSSVIWPASSPIIIDKAYPFLLENNSYWFHEDSDFTVTTPMVTNNDPKKEFKLKLGCEFYYIDDYHSNRQIISELPSIPIFSELDVLELNTIPDKQVTAYEGAEVKFSAEILPKSGFGSGKITAFNNTLDILNGYKVSVENLSWFDLYNENPDNENPETDPVKSALNSEFSHTLIAWDTGSRTVKCVLDARIKDSDTASDINVLTEKKVPVNILPGLNIYSPIEDLAYPLHGSVKVKTSFDSDKKLWNEIKWYLNGKLIEPGVKEPPFFIDLNRTGKWSLGASLKINNPGGDSPPPLAATVTFLVQPVDISLSPYRKILDLAEQKFQSLSLAVALNGKTAEKPGDLIPWQSDEVFAVVEPVQWKTAQVPDGFASEEFDEESFSGNLNFTSHGAATILATVTVRLTGAEKAFKRRHKKENDKFEIPIFEFPAVRADLWAIQQEWLSFSGIFPNRAIMGTQRFFHLENGTVKINNRSYTWLTDGIFDETCEIAPALLGAAPLKADRISVEWFAPKNQTSSDFSFKPQFLLDKKTEITLKASIAFGSGDSLKPGEKKYEVSVSPLSDVIDSAVKAVPASVIINKSSAVGLFFGPEDGALLTQNELLVWDGEYQVKLDKVAWLVGVGGLPGVVISPTEANFSFMREHPGEYMVFARPAFEVKAVAEDVQSTRVQLEANPTKIYVSASVVSWFLDPDRMDHLDMLYYLRPDGSPNPVWYYTNKHRIWWNVGIKASIPFVIGCSSYVRLIPEFTEANRPDITRLNYQWLTTDNLPIGNEGIVNCAEGADVPTPDKIGKYHLRLEAEGCDEIVIHTEVYVVQQITADTYKENFFIDCVRNSVAALSGFDKNTDGKTLIDTFYFWWWNSNGQENGNHLEYGAQAWSVKDVILRKGGMCGGLGNYFYKSLKCHGFAGLNRIGFDLLTKNYPVPDSDSKSLDPVTTEYWGAVIYTDPGLNQETMPDNKFTRWPSEISTGTYHLSYANRYTGADKIPPIDIQKVVIDRQLNVEVNTTDRFYMFFAPNDGHALVFYTDSSTQTWLYDPSFGSGKYGAIKVDFPDLGKDTIIKRLGIATNDGIWSYLAKSIGYLRGFTYFKDHNIYKGISVFDIPFNSVNYLKVRFRKYVDYQPIPII